MIAKVQRKKIWINKSLQGRIAFHLLIFMLLCCVVAGIDYLIFQELVEAKALTEDIGKLTNEGASQSTFYMLAGGYIVALLILNISFFYGLSLYISHRIAGPIINITNKLQLLQQGDLSARVNLRKGDYLIDIQVAVNELAESLTQQASKHD